MDTCKPTPHLEAKRIFAAFAIPVFTRGALLTFYKLPGWLISLEGTTLIGTLAYVQAYIFAECILGWGGLLILGRCLPRRWFPFGYGPFACTLALTLTIGMTCLIPYVMELMMISKALVFGLILVVGSVILGTSVACSRNRAASSFVLNFADRLLLLSWLYVPISLVALVIVIIRILTYYR